MLLKSFEMDARRAGIQEGIVQGRSEGIQAGISQGSYQKARETAQVMRNLNYPVDDICKISGLSAEEIEKL